MYDMFHETGYPYACEGAFAAPGDKLESCEATHAEANALLQCHNAYEIDTAYCTASPCIHCIKLLLNTSCKKIVYAEVYPHPEALARWERAGRIHTQVLPTIKLQ